MKMLKEKIYKIYNKYVKNYKDITEINYNETMEMIKNNKNTILLDVRSKQEYQEYHLNNSINIPLYNLQRNVKNILKSKKDNIIVYCQSGIRSKKAVNILKELGFTNVYNLNGRDRFYLMSI